MSKIKELKEQNPELMIDVIQLLSERDPSGKNKYLPFMINVAKEHIIKYVASGHFMDTGMTQLFNLIKDFHRLSEQNLIDNKDIYSYENPEEIEKAIQSGVEKEEQRKVKSDETITLFEDEKVLLLKPLTESASNIYGKNTRWCTSANDNNRFLEYCEKGTLIYLIWKKTQESLDENLHKLAINKKTQTDNEIVWDAADKETSALKFLRALCPVSGSEEYEKRRTVLLDIIEKEYLYNIPNVALKKENGKIVIDNKIKESLAPKNEDIEKYVKEYYQKY